jgi:hypothetical protein
MKFLPAFAVLLLWSGAALSANMPVQEGMCVWTKIAKLGHRLQNGENGPVIPGSGSAVVFANGGNQVCYDEVDAVHHARKGDRVLMCLISIPHPCPPGDGRGRWYTTTDLRTMESWTMMDSEHSCGGA